MPKVSIVLPTYNGQEYIDDAIRSIINQTYRDWELLIVNDCSTDNTAEIARRYEQVDNRIKIINNAENKKLPASLNIGFREAVGEYLTWTSDDNIYLPDAIEKMVNYLNDSENEIMVCAKMIFMSELGKYQGISRSYSKELMCYSNCVGACFLYRREVLNVVGEYAVDLFLVEDYEYWLRILFKYNKIGYIDNVLYIYRNQSKSLTATRRQEILYKNALVREKYIDDVMKILEHRRDYLCGIYYKILFFYKMNSELRKKFIDKVEVLTIDKETELKSSVIVYGAGVVGRKFASKYKDRIVYFADRDKNKVGEKIEDIEVVSLEMMKKLNGTYQIVVAASIDNVYDFLNTLSMLNIDSCYVYKEAWSFM